MGLAVRRGLSADDRDVVAQGLHRGLCVRRGEWQGQEFVGLINKGLSEPRELFSKDVKREAQ